jgi:acyl dehydratase
VAPTIFDDVDALLAAAGQDLGATGWSAVQRWHLTAFAAVTGAAWSDEDDSAPPMFALALTNLFLPELLDVRGASSGINYGSGPVRFGPAIRPGDRVRGRANLVDAVEVPGGVQTTIEVVVEVEGRDEWACTVESLSRWMR